MSTPTPPLTNTPTFGHVRAALHRALPAETALAVMARIDELFSVESWVMIANAHLLELRGAIVKSVPRFYSRENHLNTALKHLKRALDFFQRNRAAPDGDAPPGE